ncbi:hypothetical protein EAF04_000477 [Stromatinia cepivora]|nr:hypothetical protein EAF04_000477 [Stromatinia cepivora]
MAGENQEMEEEYDLVIIGAARQYPGFRSESGLRMTGFSDRPIVLLPEAHTYHDTFEAKYVTQYLEEYVDVHVYGGKSLRDRVIFGFKVAGIEKAKDPRSSPAPKDEANTGMEQRCPPLELFAALSPSCFTPQTWVSRFIHQSSIINGIVSKIWKGADEDAAKLAHFEREDALAGSSGLKPESEIYWCNGPMGLIHHDDFWETVAKNVKVYRGDIQRLEPRAIILEDGTEVVTDMLLCGTGWTRGYPFLTPQQIREFGLPHPPEEDPSSESEIWESLTEKATQEILSSFPKLRNPSKQQLKYRKNTSTPTPTRLYNLLTPLSDLPTPSLVFLSHLLPHRRSPSHLEHGLFLLAPQLTHPLRRHTRNSIHQYIFGPTVSGAR